MKKNKFIIIAVLIALLSGCSTLGTKEPSDEEINAQAAKAYADVKSKSKLSNNKGWNDVVQRVVKRIADTTGENFQWEAVLIDSPEVNAWCMPGGKIAVYTGIMPVLKTEAALAAVLGHEVAHATLRHGKQAYARSMNENLIGMVVGGAMVAGGQFLCKTSTCKTMTALGGVATGFAVTFFDRKFSRKDESAADKQGQIYMANAGYDPAEAPRLWDRMSAASGGKAPPEFMSTHPSDANRKEMLNSWMPDAEAAYSQAPHKYGLGSDI
ncbi:MAG: M48 family metallopeptidase [Bacteriovorax sp.]|nr:M48 family metallopeptidase [Bacteriovorax sp.]